MFSNGCSSSYFFQDLLLFYDRLIVLSAGVAEQFRPEKPCPLKSLLVLPFTDQFRIAAQKDLRHLPAFVVGRSRVNRGGRGGRPGNCR